ncbi:MAG: non-homologous end-joining DNA ligase [Actinobacteria bacterium]|nr:non-homologous end-joining DNA ligase [Actinomycetota bacterium]
MSDPFDILDEDQREVLGDGSPRFVEPMKATLTDERFSDPDWIFEAKLDGVRAVGVRDGDDVQIISRNEKNMNASYPELVEALGSVGPGRLVVDGEIVAFEDGRTSFQKLQGRMNVQDPERARRTGIRVYWYLFDVMHLDGNDTVDLPQRTRKELLRRGIRFEDPLRFSTHRTENGLEFYREACRQGWEGLIAKRATSVYKPGSRSRDWLKFKCVNQQEFVIGGFTDPRGSRVGFGALLLGYQDDGRFRYAGKVGTGWDDQHLRELRERLDQIERETSPFDEDVPEKDPHWVTPELVCEIGFSEWTSDDRLRHPRFLGMRTDKDAQEVVREQAGS